MCNFIGAPLYFPIPSNNFGYFVFGSDTWFIILTKPSFVANGYPSNDFKIFLSIICYKLYFYNQCRSVQPSADLSTLLSAD
jgi:hypothetical protein